MNTKTSYPTWQVLRLDSSKNLLQFSSSHITAPNMKLSFNVSSFSVFLFLITFLRVCRGILWLDYNIFSPKLLGSLVNKCLFLLKLLTATAKNVMPGRKTWHHAFCAAPSPRPWPAPVIIATFPSKRPIAHFPFCNVLTNCDNFTCTIASWNRIFTVPSGIVFEVNNISLVDTNGLNCYLYLISCRCRRIWHF